MHAYLVLATLCPELNLGNSLVREGARHNEAWVAGRTSKVEKTTLGEENDSVTVGELVAVDLVFNVQDLDAWIVVKTFNVDLIIKVTDVANNSIVFHLSHMFG